MQHILTSNIKSDDNPATVNVATEDVITKEEFGFRSSTQSQRPLKLVQRLGALTSLFSLYQLICGGLALTYSPTSFNLISMIMGAISFILSILVVVWSTKTLKFEHDKTLLTGEHATGTSEHFNRLLFVSLLFRAAGSLVLVPNMLAQRYHTSEVLLASGQSTSASTFNSLTTPLPLLEVITCITFIQAARTCFHHIKRPGLAMNLVISLGNILLMGSSLALIYSIRYAQGYSDHPQLSSLVPSWSLGSLMALAILSILLSGLVWLVNYKKWRAPSLGVGSAMIAFAMGLAIFTAFSYRNAGEVARFYGDTSNLGSWSAKMLNVYDEDIQAFGCPSKYLPDHNCESPLLVNSWEDSSAPKKCLNVACAGLLGGLYSKPFLEISNLSLLSLVSCLTILVGGVYFFATHWRSAEGGSKKDSGWLIAILIIFIIAVSIYKKPYINEFDSQQNIFDDLVTAQHYEKWLGGSGIKMDTNLGSKITDLLLSSKSRFLIMGLNQDYDRITLVEEGDYSLKYQDFIAHLDPNNAEIALVRFPIDNTHDAVLGVVWLPPTISKQERETYLKYYSMDPNGPRAQLMGFPVHIASYKEELGEEEVLASAFASRPMFLEDEFMEASALDLIMQRQEMVTVFTENVKPPMNITPGDAMQLVQMVLYKAKKFITLQLDFVNNHAKVDGVGNWSSSYDDFVSLFMPGEGKIGLIHLEIEGRSSLVVVVLENNLLAQRLNELKEQNKIPDFKKMQEQGVYLYIAHSLEELKLENLMRGIMQNTTQNELIRTLHMSEMMNLWSLPAETDKPKAFGGSEAQNKINIVEEMRERMQTTLVSEVGTRIGMELFKMVTEANYKYLIQRYNHELNKVEISSRGEWNKTNYDTFLGLIKLDEPQVSFVYLNLEDQQKLVMIIYVPENFVGGPEAAYKMFNLPSDPTRLESIGFYVYLARNKEQLNLESVLRHMMGEDVKLKQLLMELEIAEGFAASEMKMDYKQLNMRMLSKEDSGNDIIKTMQKKTYKYMIMKKDRATNKTSVTNKGSWGSTLDSFVKDFDENEEQIAMLYLHLETLDKLVLIAYAPEFMGKETSQILKDFNLPEEAAQLEKMGVSLYRAKTKEDVSMRYILRGLYTDMTTVQKLIAQYNLRALLELDETFTSFCSCSASHSYPPLLFATEDMEEIIRNIPHIMYTTEDMEEIIRNIPHTMYTTEEMEEIIRNLPKTVFTTEEMEEIIRNVYGSNAPRTGKVNEIIRNKREMTLNLFGKMGLSLSRDIVKPLKKKEFKYIILKKDPADKGGVYIGSSGSWHATFDQFVREFEPDQDKAQVGFIYLEVEGMEKLVMVVYAPDSVGRDAKKVVQDFDVTNNKPEKLKKKGISTYIAHELGDLTLDNMMKSVFGPDTHPVIKLMELLERHTPPSPECNMMATWGLQDIIEEIVSAKEADRLMLIGKKGLNLNKEIVNTIMGLNSKYVILERGEDGKYNITKQGTWHASFDQFVRDFAQDQDQVGFIYLEIESERKLVMVLFAPNSDDKGLDEIFKEFMIAKSPERLEKNDITTFIARGTRDLVIERVLEKTFHHEDVEQVPTVAFTGEVAQLKLPADVIDAIKTRKYKYMILRHHSDTDVTKIEATGDWGKSYKDFVKDLSRRQEQIAFIYIEMEMVEKLVMIVFTPQTAPTQVLRQFGLPEDVALIEKTGLSVFVAHKRKDLEIFNVLDGIYNPLITPIPKTFFNGMQILATDTTEHSIYDSAFRSLRSKVYRFVVLSHDERDNRKIRITAGDWNMLFEDFTGMFDNNKEQVGFIWLGEKEKEKLYMIVVAAGSRPPGQVLNGFMLPAEAKELKTYGLSDVNTFTASQKKDIDLQNVVLQSTTASTIMLFGQEDLHLGKDVVDALANKKYKYMILKHDSKTDTTIVESTGKWGSNYKDFMKDFSRKEKQMGLIYLEVEAKEVLVLIVYAPKASGTQTLREFGLPDDLSTLDNLGIKPYIARSKKELDLFKVLEGVYDPNTFNLKNPAIFLEDPQTQLVESTLREILDKKVKYAIMHSDPKTEVPSIKAKGDFSSSYDDFLKHFEPKENQVGITYLNGTTGEELVIIVFMPEAANENIEDLAKHFHLPADPRLLNRIKVNIYFAKNIEDLKLAKVQEAINTKSTVLSKDSDDIDDIDRLDPLGLDDDIAMLWSDPDVSYDGWTMLLSLQDEVKKKVAQYTIDNSVEQAWKDLSNDGQYGFVLVRAPSGSLKLSAEKILKGKDITYHDFLSQLKNEPEYALVKTKDLVEETGVNEPILFTWIPKTTDTVKRAAYMEGLDLIKTKLAGYVLEYFADDLEIAQFNNVAEVTKAGIMPVWKLDPKVAR